MYIYIPMEVLERIFPPRGHRQLQDGEAVEQRRQGGGAAHPHLIPSFRQRGPSDSRWQWPGHRLRNHRQNSLDLAPPAEADTQGVPPLDMVEDFETTIVYVASKRSY